MQWADVYDRDVKDIFAVEDEIADAIVASVTSMAGQPTDSAE
jgi:TolB-like protein